MIQTQHGQVVAVAVQEAAGLQPVVSLQLANGQLLIANGGNDGVLGGNHFFIADGVAALAADIIQSGAGNGSAGNDLL